MSFSVWDRTIAQSPDSQMIIVTKIETSMVVTIYDMFTLPTIHKSLLYHYYDTIPSIVT